MNEPRNTMQFGGFHLISYQIHLASFRPTKFGYCLLQSVYMCKYFMLSEIINPHTSAFVIHTMSISTAIHSFSWGPDHLSLNVSFINFIRPQGRDHPPCWLCNSFYGVEIIHPIYPLTNHSYHEGAIIHLMSAVYPRYWAKINPVSMVI